MHSVKLSDHDWQAILAFLRTRSDVYIGQEAQCRVFVEAILWVARSGAQWRLLPSDYGNWNSIYKRFARWCDRGVWTALFAHFREDSDMEWLMLDSTVVRAHPCAAGASKKRWASRPSVGS